MLHEIHVLKLSLLVHSGWIGSITGMSEAKLAISEIGVVDPDDSWGKESRFGNPFTVSKRICKI